MRIVGLLLFLLLFIYYFFIVLQLFGIIKFTKKIEFTKSLIPFYYFFKPNKK